jgi:PadR family transcriptional regulator, regulatory protein PadR
VAREVELGDQFGAHGHQPKLALRGFLLLLLAQRPAHGYDLVERLQLLGVHIEEPGAVYKALRHMDQEQLVASAWRLSSHGPTRREYSLTPEGREQLEAWVLLVKQSRDTLERCLDQYDSLSDGGLNDKGRRNGSSH